MLELRDIKKSYRLGEQSQCVLKGVSIKFRRNEFASILGASGSGKTTLLNIIGGLDHYESGDLVIEGVSTKRYSSLDWDSYRNHRVGFIFQSYNLISHQTILSNVELALTLSGVSSSVRKNRAIEALTKVGLKAHINKKPSQLSGGQMQRVAIARALVNNPEIILADEPTGALDSETSIQIMDILAEIAKDKLVIMVTHNPELAKQYSTRIIELKDGQIENDTNPYIQNSAPQEKNMNKKTMSLFTALNLSFNNLLTKKGRTILTAIAGSIGIIGIALILALANGVSQYVVNMERQSLSEYPIILEENTYDFSKILTIPDKEKNECEDNKLCSEDDITPTIDMFTNIIVKKNNLREFKKYLDSNPTINQYANEIKNSYNIDLEIYSTKRDLIKVNPNNLNLYSSAADDGSASTTMNSDPLPVFSELLDNENVLHSKYEIVAGKYPQDFNELVLIIDEDNIIPDSVLYALDIKNRSQLTETLNQINKNEVQNIPSTSYGYEDILNQTYKLILNTDYYKLENGSYQDNTNNKEYIKKIVTSGLELKIVGILRVKDSSTPSSVIGYRPSLTEYVINSISKTDIYKEQVNNHEFNILTGEKFDGMLNTYENICRKLGIVDIDNPSSISIYPNDFNSKEEIINIINQYNQEKMDQNQQELVVNYTDLIKTVISGVTSIINMVSFVLIGFVAISLIVSSIMIAIITYISVLERTKEIGILRAIGASKKDIYRVFNSETIIEGFLSGVLGIGITLLLCVPINAIVSILASIDKIANLSLQSSLSLILLSIGLTVVAGLIPANMASKKNPVEALRSE